MDKFFSRIMKKKQKMEDNFAGIENEAGIPSDLTSEIPHMENNTPPPIPQVDSDIPSENLEESEKDKLSKELAELKDKYVRLYAEFDNFKRRTSKERSDLFKTANKEVLVSLLPVLDDLERAQKSILEAKDIKPIQEGFKLITSKLKNIVTNQGLTEIKSIGENFDTDLHEAITNIPAPNPSLKGKVVDEMEKGYMLNDKVIRFAKVIVGV